MIQHDGDDMVGRSIKSKMFMTALRWAAWVRALLARFRKTDQFLIEDEELTKLLKATGRWDDLRNGNLRCSQCSGTLSLENLSGFTIVGGEYLFLCDRQICLSAKNQP